MMFVEDSEKKVCPVFQKEVQVTNLYTIETGASCQMDIDAFERSCSEQECCGEKSNAKCLLHAQDQYIAKND